MSIKRRTHAHGVAKTDPVQVETIAKHELPETKGFLAIALEGANKSKAKGGREVQGGSYPVHAHKTVLRAGDATLRRIGNRNHYENADERAQVETSERDHRP